MPTITGTPDGTVVVSGVLAQDPGVLTVDITGEVISGGGLEIFEYQMPTAQTTALITHDLGHDPVSIQVFVDGALCDEYSVTFTTPSVQVLLGFDVSVAALIRLS